MSNWANNVIAVWNGTKYAIVWEGNQGLKARCMSPDGTLVGTGEVAIATGLRSLPGLAPAKDGFVITWVDGQQTKLVSLGADCKISSSQTLSSMNKVIWPTLAWNDGSYLMLAESPPTTGAARLLAQVFSRSFAPVGSLLDLGELARRRHCGPPQFSAVWDGRSYVVSWTRSPTDGDGDLFRVRISEEGKLLDQGVRIASFSEDPERDPVMASVGGGQALLAYTHKDSNMAYQADRLRLRLWNADLPDGVEGDVSMHPDAGPRVPDAAALVRSDGAIASDARRVDGGLSGGDTPEQLLGMDADGKGPDGGKADARLAEDGGSTGLADGSYPTEAGHSEDGGRAGAGSADGSYRPEAGSAKDVGSAGAGSVDGPHPTATKSGSGCSCQTGPGTSQIPAVMLGVCLLLWRFRGRGSRSGS